MWHSGTRPICSTRSSATSHRFAGVHVNDWREPTRGWADRVLPGDGVAGVAGHPRRARRAGLGAATTTSRSSPTTAPSARAYPDSLWDVDLPSSCAARQGELHSDAGRNGGLRHEPGPERRGNDRNAHGRASRSSSSRPPRRSSSPRPRRRGRTRRRPATPIVIGWAFDCKGAMAPFDGPALAAAQLRVKQVNAKGGVDGRPLADQDLRHAGQQACDREGVRRQAASAGREHHLHDLRRRLAAPVVQESINTGLLTVAPCIGTDQMGPKRFGAKGKLAFSFGNVAQDEGSAMAQYAWGKGWRTAALATDTVIVYFKDVVAGVQGALEAARRQDRRPGDLPVARQHERPERRQQVDGPATPTCIVTSTAGAFGALSTLVTGLRTLGQRHADPQLVGRRRDVLAAEEPEGDELLLRHVRVDLRRRSRTRRSTSSRSR